MKRGWNNFLAAGLLALALAACKVEYDPSKASPSARHYSDAVTQQQFKNALEKAGIPYGVDYSDGREFVNWSKEHDPAVEKLLPLIDGPRRNYVSFPDDALNNAFLDWLTKKGIPSDSVVVDGKQYVIWQGEGTLAREFFELSKGIRKP